MLLEQPGPASMDLAMSMFGVAPDAACTFTDEHLHMALDSPSRDLGGLYFPPMSPPLPPQAADAPAYMWLIIYASLSRTMASFSAMSVAQFICADVKT